MEAGAQIPDEDAGAYMGKGQRRRKRKEKPKRQPLMLPPDQKTLATLSEVPRETHQEDGPTTEKDAPLNEDQHRERDATVPNGVPLPPTDEVEKAAETAEQTQTTSNRQDPPKRTGRDYKRRHDCLMLCFNGVLAGAAVGALLISFIQWEAMRNTLDQMKADSNSTSDGTERQLRIMSGQLEQMKTDSESSSRTSDRQLSIMEGQLKQMQGASQLEQRAWISCEATHRKGIAKGKPIEVELRFRNTGKTPAMHVVVERDFRCKPPGLNIQDCVDSARKKGNVLTVTNQGAIPPNAAFIIPASTGDIDLTEPVLNAIRTGTYVLYVFGRISYDDFFGGHHYTLYCFTIDLAPSITVLSTYDQYNDMN